MKQKFLPAVGLITAFLLSINISQAQQKNQSSNSEKDNYRNLISINSIKGGETNIEYVEGGHQYKVRLNGSKIAEMYVNDKKILEGDYAKYEPTVKRILKQMEKDRRQAEQDFTQAKPNQQQGEKERVEVNMLKKQAKEDTAQAAKDKAQAEAERKQANKEREKKKN